MSSRANLKSEIKALANASDSLALVDENIGEKGAKYLAEELSQNTALTQLDLEFNNIGTKGAAYILKSLYHNSTLTALFLPNNGISITDCMPYVRKLFETNTTLAVLNLSSNDGDDNEDLMEEIETLVNRNKSKE